MIVLNKQGFSFIIQLLVSPFKAGGRGTANTWVGLMVRAYVGFQSSIGYLKFK